MTLEDLFITINTNYNLVNGNFIIELFAFLLGENDSIIMYHIICKLIKYLKII